MPEQLNVHIRRALDGSLLASVCVDPELTISGLKSMLEEHSEVPGVYQKLVSNTCAEELLDCKTLHESGLTDDAVVLFAQMLPPETALVDACRGDVDNAFLVRYILRVGVALLFRARDGEDDSSDEEEEEERTVLDLAAQRGHAGICRELVNHEHYEDINWADSEGTTALHRAAFHFQPGVASVLLDAERFTETNAITSYGWSALHAAVPQKPPGSDEQENIIQAYDVCKLLLEHPRFTAVNLRDTECGLSVLDKAAYSGHANICALFLGSGRFTEVSSTDSAGRTALHQIAAFTGGLPPQCVLDVCRTIISDGRIDLHKKDKWGDAAYEELKRRGYHAACELFPQHEETSSSDEEVNEDSVK